MFVASLAVKSLVSSGNDLQLKFDSLGSGPGSPPCMEAGSVGFGRCGLAGRDTMVGARIDSGAPAQVSAALLDTCLEELISCNSLGQTPLHLAAAYNRQSMSLWAWAGPAEVQSRYSTLP